MGRPRSGWSLRKPRGPVESYAVRFTDKAGNRREISTGTRDPNEAAAEGARIYAADLISGTEHGPRRVDPTLQLDELMAMWLTDLEKTHDRETAATYTGYAKRFVEFFGSTLAHVTHARMGDYQRDRLTKVLAKTVRKERSALNTFLDWCVEQNVLDDELKPLWPKLSKKTLGVRSGKQRAVPVDITVEQTRAFIEALPLWSRPLRGHAHPIRPRYIFMYETGLRPATLDELSVPEHWQPGRVDLTITDEADKARYGRTVPLTPLAVAALEATVQATGRTAGLIFGAHADRTAIAAAKHAAGLPGSFAPYDLRHGRAGHLLDACGDMRAVAFLIGHKLLTTTNRYVRPQERQARAALNAARFGGEPGDEEGPMGGAKEGSRTPTPFLALEPESSEPVETIEVSKHSETQKARVEDGSGQGFGGPPETVVRAAGYLAAMRAEWDVYDQLLAAELLGEGEGT